MITVASALPHCPPVSHTPEERSTVALGEKPAGQVFEALASDTARAIIKRLSASPATASEVATAVDTSVQNAGYHLGRLEDAGVVAEADVWYSARGKEMSVYAPRVEEVVVRVPGVTDTGADAAGAETSEDNRGGRER